MSQTIPVAAATSIGLRYRAFMDRAVIRRFTAAGGRVFVACEYRTVNEIQMLMEAGHRHFAEKFVQEVESKWTKLARPSVTLHCYGHTQTNKAARACRVFDLIESLGRNSLLQKLVRLRDAGVALPPVYLQVNLGAEPQKGGYRPEDASAALEAARRSGLDVRGAMAIPPRGENPAPHFRWLRRLTEREQLPECMMGMSSDFHIAISEGATSIRVGRVIFNPQSLTSQT